MGTPVSVISLLTKLLYHREKKLASGFLQKWQNELDRKTQKSETGYLIDFDEALCEHHQASSSTSTDSY